jgi:hypothetical protein
VSNFDGRLFGGRLFAGQLFGRRRKVAEGPGGPDRNESADPRRHTDFSDDDLIQIAVALIMSGELDG